MSTKIDVNKKVFCFQAQIRAIYAEKIFDTILFSICPIYFYFIGLTKARRKPILTQV